MFKNSNMQYSINTKDTIIEQLSHDRNQMPSSFYFLVMLKLSDFEEEKKKKSDCGISLIQSGSTHQAEANK